MRLGIDASRANLKQRTGTEWYAFHLIKALFAQLKPEDDVRLYVREPLLADWGSVPPNVKVCILRWPPGLLWTQLRLSWELLIHRVDVLFVPAHTIPFLAPRRTLTTLHDIGFEHERDLYGQDLLGKSKHNKQWLNILIRIITLGRYGGTELDYHRFSARLAIRHCQTILTVSEYSKRDICTTYSIEPERVHVIPNAYDKDTFSADIRNNIDQIQVVTQRVGIQQPYIMTIGRIERKKNTLGLVKAFSQLITQTKYSNLKLLLVGKDGIGANEVTIFIQEKNLQYSVIRPGWVNSEDIPTLMAGASVFVMPSFFEGFGIPVLEAMGVGTPVVCSCITALPEVVGDAGILIDPHDPEAISSAIQSVLNDSNEQQLLRKRGFERVKKFSWSSSSAQLMALLRRE